MKDLTNQNAPANYFRGLEAVGGKLFFYENCMVFRSHSLNVQTGETTIIYSQIVDIRKRNTLGLVPNGISVITSDGFEHKFVVSKRDDIIEYLDYKRIS